jgi:hypothetical protein
MFRVENNDGATEAIFDDAFGRECAIIGMPPGSEGNPGLMLGLRRLDLLISVNGQIKVARTDAVGVMSSEKDDIELLRGAPIGLTREMAAKLIPILQYYVTHGTLPPAVALAEVDGNA